MTTQYTVFEADAPSGWSSVDFEAFVAKQRWIFARTMPENPHEYTLRRESDDAEFQAAVRFIRENGEMEQFWGRPYKVLLFGGHKFWTMGAPLDLTILINRKPQPVGTGPSTGPSLP